MNNDYLDRVDRVINYIEENISHKIDLETLADISNFSKYHFTRIFTYTVGVTPIAFVNQKRLQKSMWYLMETDKTILDISYLCGFESVSSFNAAFKKHFNKTPSEVRKSSRNNSNFLAPLRNKQEELSDPLCYYKSNKNNFLRRIWTMNISIKELPEYEVAFIRHVGSYLNTGETWGKLMEWSFQNNLFPPNQYFIGISLDSPDTVEEYACRYDACVTLPEGFEKENHSAVQFKKLPGGLYALYQFYDTNDKLAIAYQSIFGQWLPDSEYDADDRDCLEFCMNNPFEDPEGKSKVDLYIPIRKRV